MACVPTPGGDNNRESRLGNGDAQLSALARSYGLVVRAAIAVEPDKPLGPIGHLSYNTHEL